MKQAGKQAGRHWCVDACMWCEWVGVCVRACVCHVCVHASKRSVSPNCDASAVAKQATTFDSVFLFGIGTLVVYNAFAFVVCCLIASLILLLTVQGMFSLTQLVDAVVECADFTEVKAVKNGTCMNTAVLAFVSVCA